MRRSIPPRSLAWCRPRIDWPLPHPPALPRYAPALCSCLMPWGSLAPTPWFWRVRRCTSAPAGPAGPVVPAGLAPFLFPTEGECVCLPCLQATATTPGAPRFGTMTASGEFQLRRPVCVRRAAWAAVALVWQALQKAQHGCLSASPHRCPPLCRLGVEFDAPAVTSIGAFEDIYR